MWESVIKILAFIVDLIPDDSEDDSKLVDGASPESLKLLSESHVQRKVWKNLSKAQKSRIKYLRRKARIKKKLDKKWK